MNLPHAEKARVDKGKITNYLLSTTHPDGSGKAIFFTAFGFSAEHWGIFAEALQKHGASHPVVNTVESDYGICYTVEGEIETPDKRNPRVKTVWIVEKEITEPRLITAHPVRGSK